MQEGSVVTIMGCNGAAKSTMGFDTVFVSGTSRRLVFLYINDGKAELRDAGKLGGKNCVEREKALMEEAGEKRLRAATIGPAGEHHSLMACIINDGHRAAGRGGGGAVMGSKNLKIGAAGSLRRSLRRC